MEDIKYYDLNLGQETVNLQLKYTLFDRVVNILFAATSDEELDFDIMEKAFNLVVERNDCLRIRFKKIDGVLKQYFVKEDHFDNIPRLTFNTLAEQEAWIDKVRKRGIAYKKGKIIEPYFINTYDGKYMAFIKVCHLAIDMHGINIIYNDWFGIYDALKNNTELPEAPLDFETDVIKSNERHSYEKNTENYYEFFKNYLSNTEEPTYAGISGDNCAIWRKINKQGKRSLKTSFFDNATTSYEFSIGPEIVTKAIEYCSDNHVSLNSFFFYSCSLACSLINHKVKHMLPLLLSNCRPSADDKKFAGCKVQSLAAFTDINFDDTFANNINNFQINLLSLYRRINFPDAEFEQLLHKVHRSSIFTSYYSITFSFIPYVKRPGLTYQIYSNQKGALPCYMVLMFDIDTNEIRVGYDVQDRIITAEDTRVFHEKYLEVLKAVIANPDISLNDLFE